MNGEQRYDKGKREYTTAFLYPDGQEIILDHLDVELHENGIEIIGVKNMRVVSESKMNSLVSHYKAIMEELGIKTDPENEKTPERVVKALLEMTRNDGVGTEELDKQMTVFSSPGEALIEVSPISFTSLCAHHHMPFVGTAYISYVPDEHILGLSKFPRAVEWFSRKPSTQETLTIEIGKYLVGRLRPRKLTIVLEAEHTCVSSRGVKAHGVGTKTTYAYPKGDV
ncbi:GTP cyclohydrolase 1 [compost metagenome]